MPEYRHARGKRYALNTILVIAVAARLAGYRGVNAFAQFAALLSQEQLEAVGAFWSPWLHPGDHHLPRPCRQRPWTTRQCKRARAGRMDGKDLRGASKQPTGAG